MVFTDRKKLITFGSTIDYKTWYINEQPVGEKISQEIYFTSNGQRYSLFKVDKFLTGVYLFYDNQEAYNSAKTPIWTNQAYRTVVFDTEPTGALRTWMEANATPI